MIRGCHEAWIGRGGFFLHIPTHQISFHCSDALFAVLQAVNGYDQTQVSKRLCRTIWAQRPEMYAGSAISPSELYLRRLKRCEYITSEKADTVSTDSQYLARHAYLELVSETTILVMLHILHTHRQRTAKVVHCRISAGR